MHEPARDLSQIRRSKSSEPDSVCSGKFPCSYKRKLPHPPTALHSHQTQECVGVRNATPTGVPLRRDIGDWGKQGLRARGQRTLLKVHASAHERVLAVVVTDVTPEGGVTWLVARAYVPCRVESCVIPCCTLGRESCVIPRTGVTPEGGVTCHVLCLVESCVIPCGTLGSVMRDSPDGRHTRGRGGVTSCTVHCCRTACTTHGVRWGPGKVPALVRARTMPVGPSHLVRSSSRRT